MGFSGNGYSTATTVITSEGDLRIGDSSGDAERLAIGANLTLLQSNGSTASWVTSAGQVAPTLSFIVSLTAEDGDATVADNLAIIRMPFAFEISGISAFCNTAPTGSTLTFDITEAGSTILSTLLTIDVSEKTSTTAATPVVISDSTLAADAIIGFNCDQIGSSTAGAGIKIIIKGYQIV
jgi:hypothetical protein